MTVVRQAVQRPEVVLRAIPVKDGVLRPGSDALILTTPLSMKDHPEFVHLAAGWAVSELTGLLHAKRPVREALADYRRRTG